MDEQNIESRLRDRFEVYEDPTYDEENWEKLSRTLGTLSDAPKSPFYFSPNMLKMGVALLLFSNLILIGFLLKQNKQIEDLVAVQSNTNGNHTPTLKNEDSASAKSSNEIVKNDDRENKEENLDLNVHLPGPLVHKEPVDGNEKNKLEGVINEPKIGNSLKNEDAVVISETQSGGQSLISNNDAYLPGSILDLVSSNILNTVELQNPLNASFLVSTFHMDNKGQSQFLKNDKKKFVEILRPGIFVGLPRISTDISKAEPGYEFGLDLEIALSDRFHLYTGTTHVFLSYKIDDHGRPEELNELLSTYPAISEDQSIRNLHEIFADARTLEFPIGVRYELNKGEHLQPFIDGGIYGKLFLKQFFEYEYSISEDRFIKETEIRNNNFNFGGIYTSIGSRFRLTNKSMAELSLFYRQDLIPQGSEGRKFSFWGIKGAVRLVPSR
ncbi:MAG: hypothetical protein R8P61_32495 [Bacteroidia bacterium]|nr:hypothetical protein [Bacteroidia bacterium]